MKAFRIGLAVTALLIASVALVQAPATRSDRRPGAAEAAAAAPAKELTYTDDYRISVNEDAESDGEIVFGLTPREARHRR